MLAATPDVEVDVYPGELASERVGGEHTLMDRNGHARSRKVRSVAKAVAVRARRVNDRRVAETTGEKDRLESRVVGSWSRRSTKVTEVLPVVALRSPVDHGH